MKANFKKVQIELDQLPVCYLSGYPNEYDFENFSLSDFILQFLVSLSAENKTYFSGGSVLYCGQSKRRSIGDIYRICKFYYNNVTLYEVQHILAQLWSDKKVGFFYCNSVKKRVYMSWAYYKTHSVNPVEYASGDEHGISNAEIKTLSNLSFESYV